MDTIPLISNCTHHCMERDYERIFVGNRQIDIRHFYQVAENTFSVGYMTHDGHYVASLYQYDGDSFTQFGHYIRVIDELQSPTR